MYTFYYIAWYNAYGSCQCDRGSNESSPSTLPLNNYDVLNPTFVVKAGAQPTFLQCAGQSKSWPYEVFPIWTLMFMVVYSHNVKELEYATMNVYGLKRGVFNWNVLYTTNLWKSDPCNHTTCIHYTCMKDRKMKSSSVKQHHNSVLFTSGLNKSIIHACRLNEFDVIVLVMDWCTGKQIKSRSSFPLVKTMHRSLVV